MDSREWRLLNSPNRSFAKRSMNMLSNSRSTSMSQCSTSEQRDGWWPSNVMNGCGWTGYQGLIDILWVFVVVDIVCFFSFHIQFRGFVQYAQSCNLRGNLIKLESSILSRWTCRTTKQLRRRVFFYSSAFTSTLFGPYKWTLTRLTASPPLKWKCLNALKSFNVDKITLSWSCCVEYAPVGLLLVHLLNEHSPG